jgi:Ca-activated chloride channel homolog
MWINCQLCRLISTVLFLLVTVSLVAAQSGRRPTEEKERAALANEDAALVKIKTSEVLLTATVRNQAGSLATGLSERDFIVIEDGVRQEITSFNVRQLPINIVLLLDASGSVFTELKEIRAAAIQFIQQLRPEDRVCVIQFADKVELIQDWTSNYDDLKHTINWRYRPGKSTHLWDGIFLAADEKLNSVDGRKAIVILTDGDDTQSKVTRDQAYFATIKSGAGLYVISQATSIANKLQSEYGGTTGKLTGTKPQVDAITAQLELAESGMAEFAKKTGGSLFAPRRIEDLKQAYLQIAEELKNQYIITYVPSNDKKDGRSRRVQVLLTRPGLTVNSKEAYVAPTE